MLAGCGPVCGAILLSLDNPVQAGSPGDILNLVGTITNTGPESFPAGFSTSFPPGLPADFAEVLVPLSFADFRPGPGESYTGEILGFRLLPGSAGRSFTVSFSLSGFPEGSSQAIFSNAEDVTLTGVPEPSSAVLILSAGVMLLLRQLISTRRSSEYGNRVERRPCSAGHGG
jgi:hypothetical protein